MQAGAIGEGSQILVLDMGKPVKIYDLAKQLISLAGLTKHDIEIKYTGLRPGEKLFEELLLDGEHVLPTIHPLVKVAKVLSPLDSFQVDLNNLLGALNIFPGANVVRELLQKLIPEFRSQSDDCDDGETKQLISLQ